MDFWDYWDVHFLLMIKLPTQRLLSNKEMEQDRPKIIQHKMVEGHKAHPQPLVRIKGNKQQIRKELPVVLAVELVVVKELLVEL